VPETPQYFSYLHNFVANSLERECEAKAGAKKHKEELLKMEQLERQQREQNERMRRSKKKTSFSDRQIQEFLKGAHESCHYCHMVMKSRDVCMNQYCIYKMSIDKEPLMKALREYIVQQQARIAELEKQLQQQTATA
jgi:hypothetical protein